MLKPKVKIEILKTETENNKALSRLIGLLSFLALAGFRLENSKLGKTKLDDPKLDESNRHQRLCKDCAIIADAT